MWSVASILLLVSVSILAQKHDYSEGDSCTTSDGKLGTCIKVSDCPLLRDVLKLARETDGRTRLRLLNVLRKEHRGFKETVALVCCAHNSVQNDGSGNWDPSINNNNNNQGSSYRRLEFPKCGLSNGGEADRVVGGTKAELGAWPWMAALGYDIRIDDKPAIGWRCAGSLISSRHVLTAAHCVKDNLYIVRIGDLNLSGRDDGASPVEVLIEKKIVHPAYKPPPYINDIAVLKLAAEVEFTRYIHPICLPWQDAIRNKDIVDYNPFIAGWGSLYYRGPRSNDLMQTQVTVQATEICEQAYQKYRNAYIDDRIICAGGTSTITKNISDACQGDSGGPLMLPVRSSFYVLGIVSYGLGCATPDFPAVYTRVSSFLPFIEENLV